MIKVIIFEKDIKTLWILLDQRYYFHYKNHRYY